MLEVKDSREPDQSGILKKSLPVVYKMIATESLRESLNEFDPLGLRMVKPSAPDPDPVLRVGAQDEIFYYGRIQSRAEC